jgi:nitrite reductase/ring-hydroxylating ferredoxin subunit
MLLCHLHDLPDGGSRGFDPQRRGQDSLLLVRRHAQVWAWADACPHHGTPMAWRKDEYLNAAKDRIVCAAHGAQFDIASGLCTLGPCLGQHLQAMPIHLQANGEIHLADTVTSSHQETSA